MDPPSPMKCLWEPLFVSPKSSVNMEMIQAIIEAFLKAASLGNLLTILYLWLMHKFYGLVSSSLDIYLTTQQLNVFLY